MQQRRSTMEMIERRKVNKYRTNTRKEELTIKMFRKRLRASYENMGLIELRTTEVNLLGRSPGSYQRTLKPYLKI